jgi:hypothetical protein
MVRSGLVQAFGLGRWKVCDVIRLLVEHGADREARDENGDSALT